MDDLISRQAALAAIDKNRDALLSSGMAGAEHILVHYGRRVIEELPTIEPKREYSIDLEAFAEWVAKQVCREDFDEDGTFAEMACRRLWRLGFVRMNGDEWEYGEVEE